VAHVYAELTGKIGPRCIAGGGFARDVADPGTQEGKRDGWGA